MKYIFLVSAVVAATGCAVHDDAVEAVEKARARRAEFTAEFMDAILAEPEELGEEGAIDPHAPVYAMAALYTGKDLAGGNRRLSSAWERVAGSDGKLTPKEASEVKWHMRGMLRVYYLFHDKSDFFPGRLEKDVQAKMEDIFFNYGCYKSTVKRADLKNIWHIQGSENHDMMDLSNAYLSLQAVQDLPAYKDRKLPDGHTPTEHVRAWEKYYAQYALERAKNGLFVEISPTYGKWFVGEFVNMHDFTDDPTVKKRMAMLLHLMWADWSVDQLNGVRGGGKTRCYQGHYSQLGGGDSWDRMAQVLFGMENWAWNSHGGLSTLALLTSRYELPEVVYDIALSRGDFEPFVYQSTRPARQQGGPHGVYVMDPKGSGILRYSYCMPESVMGSWMVDTRASYAAINDQNRWQGVIFATGPDARVFPQSVGLGNGKTYSQHVAVQHRNVMVVAHHPKANQTGQMRVFFPAELRKRLVEKDGWAIVKEGAAWLGVRPLGDQGFELRDLKQKKVTEASRQNSDGAWLWPKADRPPVVLVLSRETRHKTLDDFFAYLESHEHGLAAGKVTYSFVDDLGEATTLEVGGKLPVPNINGKAVDLFPKKVFDSPYVDSLHGSGVVTLSSGDSSQVMDFNK